MVTNTRTRMPWLCLGILLLTACASTGLDMRGVDESLTPGRVFSGPQHQGRLAAWGGVIIHSENLREYSRLEVLAYPLGFRQRPDTDAEPYGRILVENPGYLETSIYSAGRTITIIGMVGDLLRGKVGESDYLYPTINARQLHLWPEELYSSEPSVHFGVGVVFH